MLKKIKNLIVFVCLITAMFAMAHFAVAATVDPGLNYAAGTGLSADSDPRVIAANIIRIALGFLGIIAVGLIIYAGWLYMTAAGEADKVEKAKKILIGAIIGLLICLASFAIASYILGRLTEITGPPGPPGPGICEPACSGLTPYCCNNGTCVDSSSSCPGGGPDAFAISATVPHDQQADVVRNVVVKVYFNRAIADTVSQAILDNNLKVEKIADVDPASGAETALAQAQAVDGAVDVASGRRALNFKSEAVCGDEKNTPNCFDAWSKYKVSLNGGSGIISINKQSLSCSAGSKCEFVFSTNSLIDTSGPTAGIVPEQICQDDGSLALMPNANLVDGWANDDVGVSDIKFCSQKQGEAENCFADSVKTGRLDQTNLRHSYKYDTSLYPIGADYIFKVKASDAAGQLDQAEFPAKIRPGHCCNGVKDAGETQKDCGGDCGACDGAACANDISVPATCSDNLCASQTCRPVDSAAKCSTAGYAAGTTSCCLCQTPPIITGISPAGGFCKNEPDKACLKDGDCASGDSCDTETPNGKAGNFFIIYGRNFGASTTPGMVYASSTTAGWVKAELADIVAAGGNAQCKNVWSDNKITAIVPGSAQTGAIKVENSGGLNTTSDKNGVLDFKKNNIDRPGICELNPDHGKTDEVINYYGIKLSGASPYFGNINNNVAGVRPSFNDNKTGTAAVPNITAGQTSSFVMKDKASSNYLDFYKDRELYKGPFISSFDPKEGTAGQYVTINGHGFGTTTGAVYFGDMADNKPASFEFPEKCKKSIWSDKQVIVKVPDGLTNGNYKITMEIGSWPAIDTMSIQPETDREFRFDSSLTLKPGLCKIKPEIGKVNTQVSLYGEYFGDQATAKIRFQANKDQLGSSGGWGKEGGADTATTTVPVGAVTGPVKVVQTRSVNTAAGQGVSQVISNGINFKVEVCKTNADCGSDSLCCSAGTPYANQCKDTTGGKTEQDVCFPEIKSCVYEWNFNTAGGGSCNNNLAGSCSPNNNKCLDPTKPVCDPATCLCKEAIESCSGYGSSLASCYGQICPNSPGQCSTSQAKSVDTGVACNNEACKKVAGCLDRNGINLCSYNATLKKCQQGVCDLTKAKEVSDVKDIDGNQVALKCGTVDKKSVWYYDSNQTCAASGYTKSIDKTKCLGAVCDTCSIGFNCQQEASGAGRGVCATDKTFCPAGSSCNAANRCVTSTQSSCECCCDISKNTGSSNPGCCTGLTCGDTCGSDTSLTDGPNGTNVGQGKCTGCTVKDASGINQAASNASCNCKGTSGKFCSTSGAGGLGTCQDCSSLSGLSSTQECNQQGVGFCCVDATKNNACRGGTDYAHVAYNNNNYCAYYKCNDGNNGGCNTNNPVASSTKAIYLDTTRCTAACGQCVIKGDSCTETITDANGNEVVNQAASNNNCCPGTSGKYCNSAANNGDGVCESCSKLADSASCSAMGAGACCVDAKSKNSSNSYNCVGGTSYYYESDNPSAENFYYQDPEEYQEVYRQDFNVQGDLASWTPAAECGSQYSVEGGFLNFQGQSGSNCSLGIDYDKFNFTPGRIYRAKIKLQNTSAINLNIRLDIGVDDKYLSNKLITGQTSVSVVQPFNINESQAIELGYNHIKISDYSGEDDSYQIDYIAIEAKKRNPYAFCAYYSCGAGDQSAQCQGPQKTGTYRAADCGNQCVTQPQFGETCFKVSTSTKNQICDESICKNFSCLNADGSPATATKPDSCGTCCCQPGATGDAQCKAIYNKLICVANKGNCSSNIEADKNKRGLCCGCSRDDECGGGGVTNGCGTDTCCDGRPSVVEPIVPKDGAGNDNDPNKVCRNALIKATFNRPMSINTFSGNVIVAGFYGEDQCPADTTYLTAAYKPTFFAKIKFWLAKLPLINKLFADAARADAVGNFCAIKGTVNGTNNKDTATLEFSPSQILEPDRKYYVIIKGDTDITDAVKQGVLSASGISMNPANGESGTQTFNGVTYQGKIWSFTTLPEQAANSGVCKIAYAEITPASRLFQTNKNDASDDVLGDKFDTISDSDLVYTAAARAKDGTALNSLTDIYSWTWTWTSGSPNIFELPSVAGLPNDNQLVRAKATATEGKSVITAVAAVSGAQAAGGESYSASADAYLMVCSNPWPAVKSDGTWEPWRDFGLKCSAADGNCDGLYDKEGDLCGTNGHCQYNNCTTQSAYCDNTNFELYYCRDAGGPGTADDLPVIQNDSAVIRGRNLVCSDPKGLCGVNSTENDPCGSGKCQIDILKEFYFFREGKPVTSGGFSSVSALPQGGGAAVSWNAVTSDPPVVGYKIYYGAASGNYTDSVDVAAQAGATQTKEITGLTNGKKYYFALTSYNAQKAESGYSNEVSAAPGDTTAPNAPFCLTAVANNSQAVLTWHGTSLGDVNGNGEVGIGDKMFIEQYLNNKRSLSYSQLKAADIYSDNNPAQVNQDDSWMIGEILGCKLPQINQVKQGDIDNYIIYYGASKDDKGNPIYGSSITLKQNQCAAGCSASINNLANGVKYYFGVAAVDGAGNKGISAIKDKVDKYISAIPFAPAKNLSLVGIGDGAVKLSWDSAVGAAKYKIYYNKNVDSANASVVASTAGTAANPQVISGLTNGAIYNFVVRSVGVDSNNGDIESVNSNKISVKLFAPAKNLSLVGVGDKAVKLSWDSAVGAAKYKIYYNQGGDVFTNFVATSTPGTTAKPQVVSGLTNGTTYYFAVKSINADNMENADYSNKVSAVPKK